VNFQLEDLHDSVHRLNAQAPALVHKIGNMSLLKSGTARHLRPRQLA